MALQTCTQFAASVLCRMRTRPAHEHGMLMACLMSYRAPVCPPSLLSRAILALIPRSIAVEATMPTSLDSSLQLLAARASFASAASA